MLATPRTIDEYLARLSADKRAALQALRRAILTVVPTAEECISYQVPAFRLEGRVLVWFAAATHHCSFFPGARAIQVNERALARYDTRKGTVHFAPDERLPLSLVRKLVKARIEDMGRPRAGGTRARRGSEVAARRASRSGGRRV